MPRIIRSMARDRLTTRLRPFALAALEFCGQLDVRITFEQVLVDLVAHRLLHVEADALDELLAEGVAEFGFVGEAEAFEEFLRSARPVRVFLIDLILTSISTSCRL